MPDAHIVPRTSRIRAAVAVPGDKSLSHRALVLAAMARGSSRITGLAPGRDVGSTRDAIRILGASLDGDQIESPGIAAWRRPQVPLDCGNSGTTLRLLAGALAGRPFASTLTGDASLRQRPMRRLEDPLRALGAEVATSDAGTAPVRVAAPRALHGTDVTIPMASAQVRTAFALAALQADGASSIDGPPGFRDHTERWLASFGLGEWLDDTRFSLRPGRVPAADYPIPGDPSSAAYLWAAAALVPGSEIETPGVCLNPGRTGFLEVLTRMGATVDSEVTGRVHGDPVGTVRVRHHPLSGISIDGPLIARAIDELPLVAVLAVHAAGPTVVAGAAELRAKETDRIVTTVAMVRALGAVAESAPDGFAVEGDGSLRGGVVDGSGDHRIVMAAAIAGLAAAGDVTVRGAHAADVSWPGFFDAIARLG
jgi:3-phosphoshikimate 1-carboxyvinyltransferase